MAFKSKVKINISDSAESPAYLSNTVSAGTTHTIIGLSLAAKGVTTVSVSVMLTKSGGSPAFLIKDALIPVGGALIVVGGDQKLVLEEGDALTAYCDTAESVDAIMSYLV